jgi:Flp pilus assembly protein TadD
LEARVQIEPRDILALSRLADLQLAEGDTAGARATIEAALQVNPNLPHATLTLAELNLREGQHPEALRLVRQASEAAPADGEVAWRGGRVAMECQDWILARVLLQEAVRLTGAQPEVLLDLAEATYVTGHLEESGNLCRQILQARPTEPTLSQATQLQWLIGVYRDPASATSDSEARMIALLEQEPASIPIQMALAGVLARAGRDEEARDLYTAVLQQSSDFSPAHRELALLYARPGRLQDPAKAYDHATRARRELTTDPLLAKTLGILSYQRGDLRYAEQLLREAARTMPQDKEIQGLLTTIKAN